MSKSSMTFIVETSTCTDTNGLITEISQLLTSKGLVSGLSYLSDDGKSGSIIFNEPLAAEPAPEIPQNEPAPEVEVTLATADPTNPDNVVDTGAAAVGLGHLPPAEVEFTPPVDQVPAPEVVAVEPVVPAPVLKTGIVFIKSLIPSEPVPFKCDLAKDISELHVHSVSYQQDIVIFTYRNTIFKFPIEQDKSTPEYVVIRLVLSVDTSSVQLPVFVKVVEDQDDNQVVFGNQDTEQLGLIEQLSPQS